jgi:hypothetical protein
MLTECLRDPAPVRNFGIVAILASVCSQPTKEGISVCKETAVVSLEEEK